LIFKVPKINLGYLRKFKILLPSLDTQKKIAAILSAYDDLIENNKRRIALLEHMAEEIYREWFVRFRFPGYQQAKFEKGIPVGWEILNLNDVSLNVIDGDRGKEYPKKEEFSESGYCLFLNTGNIKNGRFDFSKCDFITQTKDSQLRKGRLEFGDIVLTTRGTVGNIAHLNKYAPYKRVRINSGMVVIRANTVANTLYFYYLFNSSVIKEQYKLYASGSAQPQLPIKDLKKIPLLIPNIKLIERFCRTVEPFNNQINILQKIIMNLANNRNRLLGRLISGKLSVENLDIQFPPSML